MIALFEGTPWLSDRMGCWSCVPARLLRTVAIDRRPPSQKSSDAGDDSVDAAEQLGHSVRIDRLAIHEVHHTALSLNPRTAQPAWSEHASPVVPAHA